MAPTPPPPLKVEIIPSPFTESPSSSLLFCHTHAHTTLQDLKTYSGYNLRRDEIPNAPRQRHHRPGTMDPNSLTPAILLVFCLLSTFLGLLVFWFFRMKGGFIWRKNDWDDYRSAVLRRPVSDDAITVFTDGSIRKGGSSVGTRTVVLKDLLSDEQRLEDLERRTVISKGGRDLWGELKERGALFSQWAGGKLRGGEAPSFIVRSVHHPSSAGSVSEATHRVHYALTEEEKQRMKEKEMIKERQKRKDEERAMYRAKSKREQADPNHAYHQQKRRSTKRKSARKDWDNRSLETVTTVTTAQPYRDEVPARVPGWTPADAESQSASGYNPSAYIRPSHLAHHMSTKTTRSNMSYMPGDDKGGPVKRKSTKHRKLPTTEEEAASSSRDKSKSKIESSRSRSKRHHKSFRIASDSTTATADSLQVPPASLGKSKSKSRSKSTKSTQNVKNTRKVSEQSGYTVTSTEDDYTSSEEDTEDYTTSESETDSDSEHSSDYYSSSDEDDDDESRQEKTLGTKVYHHPIAKRDVWNTVIAGSGSSAGGDAPRESASKSSGAANRSSVQSNTNVRAVGRPLSAVISTRGTTVAPLVPVKAAGENRRSAGSSGPRVIGYRRTSVTDEVD